MKLQPVSGISTFKQAKEQIGILGLLSMLLMVPFTLSNCFIGPGLGLIISSFPESYGEYLKLIITIPSLLSVLFSIVGGKMMQKMSVRRVFIIAGVFNIVGGLMPIVISNVWAIMASRVIYGIGFGLAFPCGATLVNAILDGEFKDKYLGFSTAFTMAIAFCFTWMAVALMQFGWKAIFGGYLVFVPMLILAILKMPNNTPVVLPKETTAAGGNKKGFFEGITGLAWFVLIGTVIYNAAIMSTSTNLSDIMMNDGYDPTGVYIGLASNLGLVGQMVIGFCFPYVRKLFKNYMPAAAMLIIGVGCAALVVADNVTMFCVGQFICGAGFGLFNPTMIVICGSVVEPEYSANMQGLYSSATGIGQGITTFVLGALCSLCGLAGNRRGPWLMGGVLIVILAVITFFVTARVEKSRKSK